MKAIRTTEMNRGPQWVIGVALVAGSFTTACAPADAPDEQTEVTQSALTRNVTADLAVKSPAVGGVVTPPVVVTPPIVIAPPVVIADPLPPPPPAHDVCGKTVRISSADLDFALSTLLGGTRIVYDTTRTSQPLYGQVYHCFYPNQEARELGKAECMAGPPQDKGRCLKQLNEDFPNIKECGMTGAAFHSYVDFGAQAEAHGAEDQFFSVDTIERDTWAGHVSLDINFVRTTIGPMTIDSSFSKDPASDRANANLSLKLSSNNPTIICDHGIACPDVELSDMLVDAQLTAIGPTADKTQLGFDAPLVTFHFDKNLNNVPDWFIDLFTDVEALIRNRVEKTLETALAKDKTRAAINEALTGLAEHFANQQINTFYAAWFDGGDLVVDYQPSTGPLANAIGCTAGVATAP